MEVDAGAQAKSAIATSALRGQIAVKEVTGGRETNPMWVSNVGSSDFERALESSLNRAGLLATSRMGSRYTLTAHILKLDQPLMGASLTVTATVQYTLVERQSQRTVFDRPISASYTAKWSDAFLGVERLKLANEGAARENISRLIDNLASLPVEGR